MMLMSYDFYDGGLIGEFAQYFELNMSPYILDAQDDLPPWMMTLMFVQSRSMPCEHMFTLQCIDTRILVDPGILSRLLSHGARLYF